MGANAFVFFNIPSRKTSHCQSTLRRQKSRLRGRSPKLHCIALPRYLSYNPALRRFLVAKWAPSLAFLQSWVPSSLCPARHQWRIHRPLCSRANLLFSQSRSGRSWEDRATRTAGLGIQCSWTIGLCCKRGVPRFSPNSNRYGVSSSKHILLTDYAHNLTGLCQWTPADPILRIR